MNAIQKAILAVGTIVFIIVIAVYPVKYVTSINNPNYSPGGAGVSTSRQLYTEIESIDYGATALRGLAVIAATAAAFAFAGKTKE